jgi:hypothetical protein
MKNPSLTSSRANRNFRRIIIRRNDFHCVQFFSNSDWWGGGGVTHNRFAICLEVFFPSTGSSVIAFCLSLFLWAVCVAFFILLQYTVSWWIRKLSCIEEVPRFFFFIQFKIKFKNLNWLQLNLN